MKHDTLIVREYVSVGSIQRRSISAALALRIKRLHRVSYQAGSRLQRLHLNLLVPPDHDVQRG